MKKLYHIFNIQVGVEVNPKNGKVFVNEGEGSNVSHIYAVGDILDGKPELTPVAIQVCNLIFCYYIINKNQEWVFAQLTRLFG